MIVNIIPAKCDACQSNMALSPSIGDGMTSEDGRPYDWLCLCGSRKFARHFTPMEIHNINQGVDLIEEVENENAKKIIERQAEIEEQDRQKIQAEFQRQRQIGRVEGHAQMLRYLLAYMVSENKRTVPKKVIEDRLKVCVTALEKVASQDSSR